MTIVINGTTGISGVDGSAGTPAVQGTDTNTGVFYPAADTVGVSTGGSERMRVDSSGNVGIGTSSPNANSKLDVAGISQSSNASYPAFQLYNSGLASNAYFRIAYDAANNLVFNNVNNAYNSSTEFMRIASSGNVGIGTSSPGNILDVRTANDALVNVQSTGTIQSAILNLVGRQTSVDNTWSVVSTGSGLAGAQLRFTRGGWTGTPSMLIDSSSNLQFNSGYGSVATAYGCRAWVNFNGTGTVAIRASGNVTSITDNGTGDYTVNFTTAMPDVNYSMICATAFNGSLTNTAQNLVASIRDQLTSSCRVYTASCWNTTAANAIAHDTSNISVAIFR